ncbi:MAG: HAD family phosphatase [Spirochaetes bacterium]|nr:HAD family phosphatase [Spirochaetota bacterium]
MSYRQKNTTVKHCEAVLFDMDGVVVDSMYAHAQCWIDVFKEHGVYLDKTDIFKREGMTGLESIADIFIEKGYAVPPEPILRELQKKKLQLFSSYQIEVYPQMFTIIPMLHSKGKKIGIVTGSFRYLVEKLIPETLLRYVDVVISVDDVQKGKPNPDPYVEAVKKLNVKPDNVIVVENAPMGIKAAKAAGLYCIAISTTLVAAFLDEADAVVHDHEELKTYLANCLL